MARRGQDRKKWRQISTPIKTQFKEMQFIRKILLVIIVIAIDIVAARKTVKFWILFVQFIKPPSGKTLCLCPRRCRRLSQLNRARNGPLSYLVKSKVSSQGSNWKVGLVLRCFLLSQMINTFSTEQFSTINPFQALGFYSYLVKELMMATSTINKTFNWNTTNTFLILEC